MEKQNPTIKEQLKDRTEEIEYGLGKIKVAEYGEPTDTRNTVLVVPGYTEGLVALNNFSREVAEQGQRRVIFPEQPKSKHFNGLSSIDDQAEAILAIIEHKRLTDKPLDIIAHSMGALVFLRVADIAQARGYSCFDSEQSRSSLIAPAGFYESESFIKLASRFAKRAKNFTFGDEALLTKTTENGREIGLGGPKSIARRPIASTKEIYPLAKSRVSQELGRLSLSPQVLIYPNDELYSWDVIGNDLENSLELFSGVSMPVEYENPGAMSKEDFAEKTGLSGDELKEAWAKNHSNASHNDQLFMPRRTAKAVLQHLDY